MAWGKEGKPAQIPQVAAYIWSADERIRAAAALTYGHLIANQPVTQEVKQALTDLETLTRDRAPLVRESAVEALGKIRSEAVIPPLTHALKDPDLNIVARATRILQNYKTYSPPAQKVSATPLPANSALKAQSPSE